MEEESKIMEENSQKNHNKRIIIIIIIAIAVVLLIGTGIVLMLVPSLLPATNNSPKNTANDNADMKSTDIEIVDIPMKGNYKEEDAEKLLQKFGLSVNGKLSAVNGVYKLGYSDEFKFIVAVENVSDDKKQEKLCGEVYEGRLNNDYGYKSPETDGVCNKNYNVTVINYDDINNVYKQMYGTDAPKKSLKVMGLYFKFYDYNTENNTYNTLECGACGGTTGPAIYKIREANLKDDTLEITVAFAFPTAEYMDEDLSHKIHFNDKSIADNLTNDDYDSINNYIVTFKQDGDNFIFQNIVKK